MKKDTKKNNLKKEYFWNTLGSGAASFISLFYLITVTRINGTSVAGAFTLSFSNACMLYAIALYSGRTFQVTETNKSINDNDFLYQRFICSVLTILMTIVIALIYHYTGLKLILLFLLCISKIIEAISDVYHGFLQKNNRLDIVGKSLLVRTILSLLFFVTIDFFTKKVIFATFIVILCNLFTLLVIDIRQGNKYKEKIKLNTNSIKKIFVYGFFTFSITLIGNFLYNIPRYGIDKYLTDKLQTIYGIVVMPATIIMLINQFIIQPLITILKDSYEKRDKSSFIGYVRNIVGVTVLVGAAAIIGGYFVGIPILEIMYGVKLKKFLISFLIIIFGACLYTLATVFSNSLIVIRKTKIQFIIYISVAIISYIISDILIKNFEFMGAAYSYLIMMSLLLVMYVISFSIIINSKQIWNMKK